MPPVRPCLWARCNKGRLGSDHRSQFWLKQQLVDAETGETVEKEDIGRGYEIGKGQYLQVEDEEIEKIRIESSHTISIGLIEVRDGRYGFRDLAAARQAAQLLGSGIGLSVITKSLREIRKWLPDARLSNLRLFPESKDRLLVEQARGHTDSSTGVS